MNAWRWFGASIFVFSTVCLLGIVNNSELGAFGGAEKKVDIKATPDKDTVEPGKSLPVALALTRGNMNQDTYIRVFLALRPGDE